MSHPPILPLLFLTLLSCTLSVAESRPNIVMIMLDDLGYADAGFTGCKDIPTPAIDALAEEGTVFTSAYVAHPVCGPSRAALMMGRYPHTLGGQFNIPNFHPHLGIEKSEVFLSTLLQQAGYYTGAFGKWHLGDTGPYHPNQRGFDEFYGILGSGHKYFPSKYLPMYDKLKARGEPFIAANLSPMDRNGKESRETEYLTDAFSREAVSFIESAASKDQPFFLYLAYNAPHAPIEAKPEDLKRLKHIQDKKRQKYAGMIVAVDDGVQRVVDSLKATGAFENSLIIFLSDNGGKQSGGPSNFPYRGGKRGVEEGGIRVPMFFHWPGRVPAGNRFEHPVLTLDFYPTLARLCGAEIPEGKVLDGKDVWDDLLAGRNPHPNEMIHAVSHRTGQTDVAMRRDEWKVLRTRNTWKLYNIEQDPGETTDLSSQYPERLERMIADSKSWVDLHPQPKWVYLEEAARLWEEMSKPYFEGTFDLD